MWYVTLKTADISLENFLPIRQFEHHLNSNEYREEEEKKAPNKQIKKKDNTYENDVPIHQRLKKVDHKNVTQCNYKMNKVVLHKREQGIL